MFFVIQGTEECSLFCNKNKIDLLGSLKKYASNITKDLGVISLKEPYLKEKKISREIPGYLAFLTSLLAKENINIVEIASTHSQVLFVIKEEELVRAYSIIDNCVKEFRRQD